MPHLGVVTCQILELEFAHLLSNDPDVTKIWVVHDDFSEELIRTLENDRLMESGIRRVVNLRMKGACLYWLEKTAEAMLMLRSYYKAGRWNLLTNLSFSLAFLTDV
jgi:hypothetical protein